MRGSLRRKDPNAAPSCVSLRGSRTAQRGDHIVTLNLDPDYKEARIKGMYQQAEDASSTPSQSSECKKQIGGNDRRENSVLQTPCPAHATKYSRRCGLEMN